MKVFQKKKIELCLLLLIILILSGCRAENKQASTQDEQIENDIETVLTPAATRGYYLQSAIWPSTDVSVCWRDTGSATEKTWVKEIVESQWGRYSALNFTGWGTCSSSGANIEIAISDVGATVSGGLGSKMSHMILNFSFIEWDLEMDGVICKESRYRKQCIQAVSLHEFGHALGIAHEANRPDSSCSSTQGSNGDTTVGAYDPLSIMNYCASNRLSLLALSATDRLTIATMYPATPTEQSLVNRKQNLCLDVQGYNGASRDNVMLYACDGYSDQLWELPPVGSWGIFKNKAQGLCLDVQGYNGASKDNVMLYACDGHSDQQWKRLSDGRIINKANNLCLDVQGYNGASRDNVMLYACDGYIDQKWNTM